MALANEEHPAPSRSRMHKARHILGELRRLRLKVERAYQLEKTDAYQQWCRSTADALDRQILAGDAVLGGFADPRDSRRARKREQEWF